MSKWSDFTDSLGITYKGTREELDKASKKTQEQLESAKSDIKSAEQAYTEGRGAAGIAAADKAGIAKKQAMAASKMGGGSKLANAIAGAGAAASASQEGYDQQAAQGATLAAQEGQAKANLKAQQAQNTMAAAQQKAQTKMQEGQQWAQLGSAGVQGLFGLTGDIAGGLIARGKK